MRKYKSTLLLLTYMLILPVASSGGFLNCLTRKNNLTKLQVATILDSNQNVSALRGKYISAAMFDRYASHAQYYGSWDEKNSFERNVFHELTLKSNFYRTGLGKEHGALIVQLEGQQKVVEYFTSSSATFISLQSFKQAISALENKTDNFKKVTKLTFIHTHPAHARSDHPAWMSNSDVDAFYFIQDYLWMKSKRQIKIESILLPECPGYEDIYVQYYELKEVEDRVLKD